VTSRDFQILYIQNSSFFLKFLLHEWNSAPRCSPW
jgi:hypothetical protein